MRNDYSKNIKRKKILFGILFVLLGTALIINALGYIEIGNIFYFIVTLFLIPIFIKGIIHLNFSSILIPPAIVGCMYAKELGITSITPWPLLLCVLFLSIGLHLIFGHRKNHKYNSTIERDDNIYLVFAFENPIRLNLSSDKTEDTQKFFLDLLQELIRRKSGITFTLEDPKEDLYHDVAQKYLENLEQEIKKIVPKIPKEI